MFDLLAADIRGYSIPIQVKAINGPSWQFRADAFLEIEISDGAQVVKRRRKLLNPNLLCIFVLLREDEKDVFYIFKLKDLQKHFYKTYKGGRRPKNPESMHCAVWPRDLEPFRENWSLVADQFP